MHDTDTTPDRWVPGWAQEAIFYHIFPLGFLDAPARNPNEGDPVPRLGALSGWLDHIAGLGATAVFLGPVFESESHGYNTIDYFTVDRRLGTLDDLRRFVQHAHLRNMRVILDGVFNHTGREFFAFRDLREHGRNSRHANWYHVNWEGRSSFGDPLDYTGWAGHRSLPQLNLGNPEVRNYLFEVCRYWLGDVGIDGWRLDAADSIDPSFWWEFRRVCKDIRSDCFLVGEVVGGDYRKYAAPDLLDSVTNYQLYESIPRSFNTGNLWDLRAALERADNPEWGLYRELLLFNFIGNHDVERINTRLENPRHIYPALILLLTMRGIPCLYYGDEIGMQGRKQDGDAALRRPMPPRDSWPQGAGELVRFVTRLVSIRKGHPALLRGTTLRVDATDHALSMIRRYHEEVAVVVINAAEAAASFEAPLHHTGLPDGLVLEDALEPGTSVSVHGGKLHIEAVPLCGGRILIGRTG